MKKAFALILTVTVLFSIGMLPASARTRSRWAHSHMYGDRSQPRVAITIDDWFYPSEWLPKFMEVAEKYNVKLTMYPCGFNLHPEDRELWQSALDAGHVIGSHFYTHQRLTDRTETQIRKDLEKYQKTLDDALGYHYEFLTVRPPYGAGVASGSSRIGGWIHNAGFDHIVLWDMDNTRDLQYALRTITNGSIVLLHANKKDLAFLEQLLEAMKDRGYEYVTVNDLLGITERCIYTDD